MALSMGMSRKEASDYVAWVNPFNPLSDLFYPVRISPDDWNKITPARAGRVIDHLLETGRVDWSIT
jgi:hypothetical protein